MQHSFNICYGYPLGGDGKTYWIFKHVKNVTLINELSDLVTYGS